MILLIDFGSQTAHLIARRVKEWGIEVATVYPDEALVKIKKLNPKGIIFSGGPSSVYEKNTPLVDKRIFSLNLPLLGICYGLQLIAYLLNGEVIPGRKKEFGPKKLKIHHLMRRKKLKIIENLPEEFRVWMSHGDEVKKLPANFSVIGSTDNIINAFVGDEKRKIYGVQFHPEVVDTQYGRVILKNFLEKICGLQLKRKVVSSEKIIKEIKEVVGDHSVIGAVSGGIDSTVAAFLTAKAIGRKFHPFFIEMGLERLGTKERIEKIFNKVLNIKVEIIKAEAIFLKKLKGVIDPEEKRKIIGQVYGEFFKKEVKKLRDARYLLQGTIYSDVIESKGTRYAAKIKTHHNVRGLPQDLGLELLEPLRYFYKDEVRKIGQRLGLPAEIVWQQPFPGPGNAIRIIGEVNKKRLLKHQQIDQILLEELEKAKWLKKVFQSFPVLTGIKSTAVKGDKRFYGEVVALRIYQSVDVMTASWAKLPPWLLEKISTRIVNEVADVSRVVYDITTKPPATMEWE